MRLTILLCSMALLSACATTPEAETPLPNEASLPTSNLAPGECGLFGWATGNSRDFIFYADEKTARYDGLDGPIDLIPQSAFPAVEYQDPEGKAVSLRLGEGEPMNGGVRYPSARVVSLTEDGWERLHPVAIVRTCQPG